LQKIIEINCKGITFWIVNNQIKFKFGNCKDIDIYQEWNGAAPIFIKINKVITKKHLNFKYPKTNIVKNIIEGITWILK